MSTTLTLNGVYNTWLNNETVEVSTPEDWNLLTTLVNGYRTSNSSDYVITNPYDSGDILTIEATNVSTFTDKIKKIKLLNDLNFQYGEIEWVPYLGFHSANRSLRQNFYLNGNGKKIFNVYYQATSAIDDVLYSNNPVNFPIIFPDKKISDLVILNCYFDVLFSYRTTSCFISLSAANSDEVVSNITVTNCRIKVSAAGFSLFYFYGTFSAISNVQSNVTIFMTPANSSGNTNLYQFFVNGATPYVKQCCLLNTLNNLSTRQITNSSMRLSSIYTIVENCFIRERFLSSYFETIEFDGGSIKTSYSVTEIPIEISTPISYRFHRYNGSVTQSYFDVDIISGKVSYVQSSDPTSYGINTNKLKSVIEMQSRGWEIISY